MEVIEVKGNKITLDLSETEYNSLFRAGLQILLDKWFGKKVVVLPVESVKTTKKTNTIELTDEISNLCVETAVNQALIEHIDRVNNKVEKKNNKAKKTIKSKYNDAADFA